MDRRIPSGRSFQQTIPTMIRMREDRSQSNSTSLRSPRSVMDKAGVSRPQFNSNSSRMNPYKVPFQRRQPVEPIYADPAPMIMPQTVHLSPAFGLGSIFAGTNGIFMPNVQQNLIEVPLIHHSKNAGVLNDDSDFYIDGLTSSPPNHSEFVEINAKPAKPQTSETKSVIPTNDSKKETDGKKTAEFKINMVHRSIGLRVLTGSIEKIIKWEQMWTSSKEKSLLFEVIAPLIQIRDGMKPNEKQLLLRESGGPVLSVMFYEIDRDVPKLNMGQYVRCVCRSLGKRRFQAFSVRAASQQEHSSQQRISFLCQRAVQEALLSIHET